MGAASTVRRIAMAIVALGLGASLASGDEPKGDARGGPPARSDATRGRAPAKPEAADFPRAEPSEVGIDKAAFERLRERAREADSDAVVIVKDGRLVADRDFGHPRGPIEAMSATKSIVSLAIGKLIDQGKIRSLDQPVHDFYPEWNQGRKKLITVRHLLNHTSGLQSFPITTEIYASPDFVQFALAAEVSDDPGTMPRHRIVAVRQRRSQGEANPEDPRRNFLDFVEMVAALVPDRPVR